MPLPATCTVSVLATEHVGPGHNSHLLVMDALSPAREGGVPEAGRVTGWELGPHGPPLAEAQHQLSHSPAQVGMDNVTSTQVSPRGWEAQQDSPGGQLAMWQESL